MENLPIQVENKRIDSPNERKQLSIEFFRKILEQNGETYTDEMIIRIRRLLYKIGYLDYKLFIEKRNSKFVSTGKD
jgi:hypothetical protein